MVVLFCKLGVELVAEPQVQGQLGADIPVVLDVRFEGEETFDFDAVDILTVHQSKGLEWPVVFLPALVFFLANGQYTPRQIALIAIIALYLLSAEGIKRFAMR